MESGDVFVTEPHLIVALDIGTTTIRCQVVTRGGAVIGTDTKRLEIIHPEPGCCEIDPENLWSAVINAIRGAVSQAYGRFEEIRCLAISTQRCTFITWNMLTDKPYHNFITWKDLRANDIVQDFNSSWKLFAVNTGSKFLHLLTRKKEFLAGSGIKLTNPQVAPRLKWVLNNIPNIQSDAEKGQVMFGTIDTWLIYKFTEGSVFVAECSNASATGLFDPIQMTWSYFMMNLMDLPADIFPPLVDTVGTHFGSVSEEIFGSKIPIRCVMSDQSAAMFGLCCFEEGSAKITMGTGSFVNVNTGRSPHFSSQGVFGMYPVVAWKWGHELCFAAEQAVNDTGTVIDWAVALGLSENTKESAALASSVRSTDGVFFIPAFSGLQAPINDPLAGTGFIGMKPSSGKSHLLRAVLESVAFRISQILEIYKESPCFGLYKEISCCIKRTIKVDGGVSQNDFILQCLSDVTELKLERMATCETSSLGAAYFAGLFERFWESKEELRTLIEVQKIFKPFTLRYHDPNPAQKQFKIWLRAVERFKGWELN